MIKVTDKPIYPEDIISAVKTASSGCVVVYIGLIREYSHGKPVRSVEYQDTVGDASKRLQEIANEIKEKWTVNKMAICHRTGTLKVGDINLVIAIAAAHREEGFAASQYAVDRFKEKLPTWKRETYQDGSTSIGKE